MNFNLRSALMAFTLAGAVVAFAPSARADTIYTYTGNAFTTFVNGASCSGGAGECSIQVTFTVASALGANLTDDVLTPLSGSITDGNSTVNAVSIELSTDSSGNIDSWNVQDPAADQGTIVLVTTGSFHGDTFDYTDNVVTSAFARVGNDPGTWTESSSAVPEPESLMLLGTGMVGLLGLGCLRGHAA